MLERISADHLVGLPHGVRHDIRKARLPNGRSRHPSGLKGSITATCFSPPCLTTKRTAIGLLQRQSLPAKPSVLMSAAGSPRMLSDISVGRTDSLQMPLPRCRYGIRPRRISSASPVASFVTIRCSANCRRRELFCNSLNVTSGPRIRLGQERVTEKLSAQASVQFSDTTYESSRLVDYRVVGGSGGLLYQLSERDHIQLLGSYVHFRTTDSPFGFRADFPGINMSLTHAFTESLTGTIYGGPRFLSSTSQTQGGDITARDTVWLAGASLTKHFERAAMHVSFSRDLVPSGFGLLIQTNRGELSGSYEISETLACSLNVVGVLTSGKTAAAIGGAFPDSSYVSLTPKLSWKFLEWWQAELSYMYRWRDIDTAIDSAQSHATTFMVTYYPPKLSFSH